MNRNLNPRIMDQDDSASAHVERYKKLSARWQELCASYLPVAPEGSLWRYSGASRTGQPEQGWKLHLSATVLNAHQVLEKVAPALKELGVPFKAPTSLKEVQRLNAGLHYSYSQVGKIFTVYPRNDQEAVALAPRLHELTRRFSAPAVPFDLRYRSGSNVYYRYGAFTLQELVLPNGERVSAIRNPHGELVPDVCAPEKAKPVWAEDPFAVEPQQRQRQITDSPLGTRFKVFGALSQRGKGGVYQAVDIAADPPRLCLLKEGRKAGELGWDGRDGHWRVKHEAQVLTLLRESGVNVPCVYASFESAKNYYLVTEFIDGESLHAYLRRLQRRMPVMRALRYGIQLSGLLAQLHSVGWVWRDCKPANLILTKQGELRPLDFEGACPFDRLDPLPWMTPAFMPPEGNVTEPSGRYDDLYALGTVLYLLLTGRMPEPAPALLSASRLRRNLSAELCDLLAELMNPGPQLRPNAHAVTRRLESIVCDLHAQVGTPGTASDLKALTQLERAV